MNNRKHDSAAHRAMYRRNGWPSPMEARIYTIKQLAMRYALVSFVSLLIGGPAVAIVILRNYC